MTFYNRTPGGAGGGAGVGALIRIGASGTLAPPVAPLHTQPYLIDSSGTPSGTRDGADYVEVTLDAPSVSSDRLLVSYRGPNQVRLLGAPVNGEADAAYLNLPAREALLIADGAGWLAVV